GRAHPGNVAAAGAAMAGSRYDVDEDGVCDAAVCRNIRILVRDDKPERLVIARIARAAFARIVIHLHIDVVDPGTFFSTAGDPAARVPIVIFESNRGLPAAADFVSGSFG